MYRFLRTVLCLFVALLALARADTDPSEGFVTEDNALMRLSGWIEANDGTFHSPLDLCVIRTDTSRAAYPVLDTPERAGRAASALKRNLEAQKLRNVQVEVLPRPDQFALLAIYDFEADSRPHRARQLYLSQDGKLKTVTGSSELAVRDACVFEMLRFLRLEAHLIQNPIESCTEATRGRGCVG